MSIIFFDGFDLYTNVPGPQDGGESDLMSRWNTQSGGILSAFSIPSLIPGRFGGQALRFTFMGHLAKALPNSYNTLTVGFSFRFTAQAPCALALGDSRYGGTGVTLQVQPDGSITLHNSSYVGTIIAHAGVGLITPNRWAFIELQVTFGQVGHYELWVDGVSAMHGQGNTGTQYCDIVTFFINWNIFESEQMDIDDVYISNDTAAPPNNARHYGAWRVEPRYPSGDTEQKDLTPQSPMLGQFDPTIAGTATSYGQSVVLQQVTSRVTGTVTSGRLYWRHTGSAKVKCVVYTTSETNTPAVPLGMSDEVIGVTVTAPAIYTAVDYAFPVPPVLLAGRTYWIGYIADGAMSIDVETLTGATTWVGSNTYVSGAPTNPSVTAVNNKQVPMTFATTTVANYVCVNEPATDDEGSYVSTDHGGEDIYLLPQWEAVPVDIWAINVISRGRKLVEGAAWYAHRLESEWTDFHGNPFAPGVNWQYHVDMLETDPNTGAPWQGKAVNALRVGVTCYLGDAPPLIADLGIVPQPLVLR